MKKRYFAVIILSCISIMAIIYTYCHTRTLPLIDKNSSLNITRIEYAGREISDYVDRNMLMNLLSKYKKKRTSKFKDYFPKANWNIEILVEISVVDAPRSWHLIFEADGDALCYDSMKDDIWEIINGDQLLEEIVQLFGNPESYWGMQCLWQPLKKMRFFMKFKM